MRCQFAGGLRQYAGVFRQSLQQGDFGGGDQQGRIRRRALSAALVEISSDARRELRFAEPGPVREAFLSIRATAEAALNAWGK